MLSSAKVELFNMIEKETEKETEKEKEKQLETREVGQIQRCQKEKGFYCFSTGFLLAFVCLFL